MTIPEPEKRKSVALLDRFKFIGEAIATGDHTVLRPALHEVEEIDSGALRTLKLWRKTGTALDQDLRQLWLHEMRQVQRVMSYSGARDLIVDVLEFLEDDDNFGVVLDRVGQPLTEKLKRAPRQHWLRNLDGTRARALFWKNVKRLVCAIGIVHAQGLVHGGIAGDVIMTEGADEPDFQLGGLEWSLWLSADMGNQSHVSLGSEAAVQRAESYSFEEDWRRLGLLIAECLDSIVKPVGDVHSAGRREPPINLNVSERILLKRLVAPARIDQLDADSIGNDIDDLLAGLARAGTTRAGTFIMMFAKHETPSVVVYDASEGEIAADDFRRQIGWLQADLDGGATLVVPKDFESNEDNLRLVTASLVYTLKPFFDEGARTWDIAVCSTVKPRSESFRLGEDGTHVLLQPVALARHAREAKELRGRLGPDALDWSVFATPRLDIGVNQESDTIRRALMLVQTVDAVVKALESYPVQILDTNRRDGRRYVTLRAQPNNDRDRVARKIGLPESAAALKRLFEDDNRDAGAKWQLSQSASLGSSLRNDVVASFLDVIDHQGRRAYQFELDEDLPGNERYILRTERDIGTEKAISRRLRNIKALDTRVDLAAMLADPWRVRRSSRENLSGDALQDEEFLDLDKPKQKALIGLWSTLPSFYVVGPPGVGKTKLATEVIRRRFVADASTRMLISAQGHDALDNLQEKIKETLRKTGLNDVLVVRSTTSDERPSSNEEVHRTGFEYLDRLSRSELINSAPAPLRERISELREAAIRIEVARDAVDREQRQGLNAVSRLVLDAANIVISTANSPDIEGLVEAREQFDWVVVEEAAKATGPELIGPLMLSGRRLLIGDHRQLPPFDADRLVKILSDHSLVSEALSVAEERVGALFHDGELEELKLVADDPHVLREVAAIALRLLEPFKTFVEDDERRAKGNSSHRPIAATLTEQRRMDPAIAEIVSKTFYKGDLETEEKRARSAETGESPVIMLGALPQSPVVVINCRHVSSTGKAEEVERSKPQWHNPSEITQVVEVLRHLRARDLSKPPTLAILSPYKAQVDKLEQRIVSARVSQLDHLDQFRSVRRNGAFVGTVDSFQGSEADVVILSLVRNNPRNMLGFLRDRRRLNVALSRAKSHLIIVGSLDFLRCAVRAIDPGAVGHELSFLMDMTNAINALSTRKRNDVPLASIITPSALKV